MKAALQWPIALPMLLYQSIVLALSQIWANKVRGILTTLGILIGVAAISAVIALIAGMQERVLAEFEAFGTNKLFINPQWRRSDTGRGSYFQVVFRNDLFDDMLERCPSIESFSRDAGYGPLPVAYAGEVAEEPAMFAGVDPQFHRIERRGTTLGRPMTQIDSQQARRVALINATLRDQLKMDRDPVGQTIETLYFGRFFVIGLMEEPVTMLAGQTRPQMLVPFTFTTMRYNWPTWYSVTATSKSRENVEEAKAEAEFYLRQKRHLKPGEEDNFRVDTAARAVDEINEMATMFTVIAGGIVAISLLVGGVGIMNIMLVSVSERTREIGLRKAVGARPGAICMQFLVEAVVLCLLGGALGLVAGQAVTSLVASYLPADVNQMMYYDPMRDETPEQMKRGMQIVLPARAVAIAFVFSASVGVIFGFFPAVKAAILDPIEALRHE